jgi:hypothetical protein
LITCGVIDVTITPTRPAHWLAEKRDNETPTPVLPPTAMAAPNGSLEVAISTPYFIADSATFLTLLIILFFWLLICSVLSWRKPS